MHLMISGILHKPLHRDTVLHFLQQCPKEIDMKIISGPEVIQKGEWLGGYVIIAESHISVHATPQVVYVDIFSCKEFDIAHARLFTQEAMGFIEVESQSIKRLIPSEA
jgi:S-adenosylmethionine decarboxylase